MTRSRSRSVLGGLLLLVMGCGKKGPPLPPLIRIPVAPADLSAIRRAADVGVTFVVPGANTDGSTPADLSRVEIYALTGASTLTPDEILSRGTRVGVVVANQPRDPDETEEQTRRREAARSPDGVEQGATVRVVESLAFDVSADPSDLRSYIAVAVSKRGRRGPFSARALVPLAEPPPPPSTVAITYDESRLTVRWAPPAGSKGELAYQVYESGEKEPVLLTNEPLTEPEYSDTRLDWGRRRCFTIRTQAIVQTLRLESAASPEACRTPTDTFAPAAPTGLVSVAAGGAVNLIWNPNRESDLAGYQILRAIAPQERLVPITAAPVVETTFRDAVASGARVTYAVQAVDKAGNGSQMSEPVVETAR